MTSRKGPGPFFLFFILFFAVGSHAQDLDDIVIRGGVTDISGAAVSDAVITVHGTVGQTLRRALTDRGGSFRIVDLPPGGYVISAESPGFSRSEASVSGTVSGREFVVAFVLSPEEIAETVSVPVSSESGSTAPVSTSVAAEELAVLPNTSADVLDLVFTLPGTDEEPFSIDLLAEDDRIGGGREADQPSEVIGAGSISLSGGAAYSTNITIDGLDNNDDRLAGPRFQPPPGAVAEVQVVANQYSAEYGRASGGRVNIRTRSGAPAYRFGASLSFEDEALNANTFNNNRRGLGRLPYSKIDPGFTVSGPLPLTSGRTRFITSALVQTRLATSLIDTMVPADPVPRFPMPASTHPHDARVDDIPNPATDSFPAVNIAPYRKTIPTPAVRTRLLQRFDHTFSGAHTLVAGYQFSRDRNLRQYRETTRFLEETLQAKRTATDAVNLSDNLVVGERFVNQFRFQYSEFRPGFATDSPVSPVVLLFISDDSRAGDEDQVRGTIVAGNSTANFAALRTERRIQAQESLSMAAGAHTMRIGADVHHIRSENSDLADFSGTFNFARVYDLIASQPSRFRRNFGARSIQNNLYAALFLQDDFRPGDSLTANLGLRYERESLSEDRNNFGPRLGIAWSPDSDGRTVVRLGAGVFYNRVLLRTPDDYAFGRDTVRFDSEALAGPASETRCLNQVVPGPNLTTDKCRFLARIATEFPIAPTRERLEAILAELGIASGGFVTETNFSRFVEDGIRVPESYQFTAAAEHQLAKNLSMEVSFTFNRASGLWRETNVNAFRPPAGFATLTEYLLSLGTFDLNGTITRFELGDPNDPVGVSTYGETRVVNLSSSNGSESSRAPIGIAFAALEALLERPFDPSLGQVEMVGASGNSVYEGLTIALSGSRIRLPAGLNASFRGSYTLSRTRDDGSVDTSSAQTAGDFRSEFSASSIDRRHRLRLSGSVDLPKRLGGFTFSPILRLESARPFNLGVGGSDRNLDDVSNDRPNFNGNARMITSRRAGDPIPTALIGAFSLSPIGTSGDLPRNAGRGPMLLAFDAAVTKRAKVYRGVAAVLQLTATNVLNTTVYSFGSDYIDLSDSAASEFARGFLVPSRTLAQRKLKISLRLEF